MSPMEGMNRPPMMGMPGPMGRPPMGNPLMGRLPPIMPPLSPADYDYDASSEEGSPDLLSSLIKQMMGGDAALEITPVIGSSEMNSVEDEYTTPSVETPEVPKKQTEIAPTHRSDGKEHRVPEEVSYRRAP